jgi:glycosyltransferase involved in cell wall biosynthesis
MKNRRRILFVKLGHFSYTNHHVADQIARNFPDHDLMVIDMKKYIKSDPFASACNIVMEAATFGPSVLRNRSDLHAYFFRTPFMFRRLNEMLIQQVGSAAPDLDLAIQTQGIFNARIKGTPLLVYTDYTTLDNLTIPDHDKRLFRSEKFLQYEKELYTSADAVAVTGSHVERTLVQRYGCKPSRVTNVHIGANVEITPVSTDLTRYAAKHVLFVGVQWERKGGPALVEGFLQALKDHPDARLTIIGCTPALTHPSIDVVGPVQRADMAQYFKAASLFCMPSLIEPLGIAVVEASLFRLPVIATQIDGFFETVTDGETGILVPPHDPAAIAAAFKRLFEAPELGRRMGLAGFDRNRTRFDWNEVGKRLRSVAESIVPALSEAA